jgi:hypothetical protein
LSIPAFTHLNGYKKRNQRERNLRVAEKYERKVSKNKIFAKKNSVGAGLARFALP